MPTLAMFRLPLLVTALLLAACSTPASRIEDRKSVYDSYPPEVQQKLAAGKVDIGYTKEQTLIALGEPRRRFNRTSTTGSEEVWSYSSKTGPSFGFGLGLGGGSSNVGGGIGLSTYGSNADERLRVVFVDGKVTAIEELLK
jgi:hypothetical protein